jgi:poly(ADP-ribose) glycohydrolase ARH3
LNSFDEPHESKVMTSPTLESRFAGAMLGTFVGDAMGAPFEGARSETVAELWDQVAAGGSGFVPRRYTDDTQLMIGVAESLIACGGVDPAHMAERFVANFDEHRGYGMGAYTLLNALREGVPWQEAATSVFPDGSWGNGAAMRIAPIGLMYYHDTDELRRSAESSASITHAHPLGKEGAALQAYAVALAVQTEPADLDPGEFLRSLFSFLRVDLDEYSRRLAAIERFLHSKPTIDEVVATLGNDVRAHTAVPAAIYAFLSHYDSFAGAVTYAVQLGGDTDTIGAMAGAIAGALHGVEAIPGNWRNELENEDKGRDYVLELAGRLLGRHKWIT